MKTQYTPGPWTPKEHADSSGIYIETDEGDACAISGGRRNGITDKQRANARLIAAAPELLAACQSAVISMQDLTPQMKASLRMLRAAIAKATAA